MRPRYLREALKEGNVLTLAQALVRFHAPSAEFQATVIGNKQSWYKAWVAYDRGPVIRWAVSHGITTLLHELGHHAMKHRKDPCCDAFKVAEEAEAWLWAERWAKKHGIKFDYDMAQKLFTWSQKGRVKVLVNWRGSTSE